MDSVAHLCVRAPGTFSVIVGGAQSWLRSLRYFFLPIKAKYARMRSLILNLVPWRDVVCSVCSGGTKPCMEYTIFDIFMSRQRIYQVGANTGTDSPVEFGTGTMPI